MRQVFYNDILNRKTIRNIEENKEIHESCDFHYSRSKDDYNETVKFMKECSLLPELCNRYIRELADIKEKYFGDNTILNIWYESILPKVTLEHSPIADEATELQIKKNRVCDRILNNHDHIQESYNIKGFVSRYSKHPDTDFVMNKICECVDKFKLPPHGKVVIALEEFYYLAEMNNIVYNNTDIINVPVEYFYKDGNTSTLLEESICKSISIPWEKDWFKPKNRNTLQNQLFSLRESILSCKDKENLSKNVDERITSIKNEAVRIIDESDTSISAINRVSSLLKDFDIKNTKYYNIYDFTDRDKIITLKECGAKINALTREIDELSDISYPLYNIKCMNEFGIIIEDSSIISLNEFKLFKFDNLLKTVSKVDKYIYKGLSNVKDKVVNRIKNMKRKIFGEASVYDMITENGSIDYIIASFNINFGVDKDIHKVFTDLCRDINESVIINKDYICYYIATESVVSIHIKSPDIIQLSESELDEYYNHICEEDNHDMLRILALAELYDTVSDYPITTDKITEFFDNNIEDTDTIKAFIELCSYCIGHTEIESAFNNLKSIREDFTDLSVVYEYDLRTYFPNMSLPNSIKLEAYCELVDILYEDTKPVAKKKEELKQKIEKDNKSSKDIKKSVDNKKPEVKTPEKKENINSDKIGGINFTNVKLVLAGLKKKVKDLGSKEQALSRNADLTFNTFVKACKNALISDRREAIIKGSVIPSFSKCIKLAIAVAGIAYVNVGAAVITVIGGLAMSKRLTNKERALLLDDIEIEIEVLDKEISMAESKNQMKKLRVLMRTKKDLQRQYQRIKYGIRVGKDILPSSNMRTPGGEK